MTQYTGKSYSIPSSFEDLNGAIQKVEITTASTFKLSDQANALALIEALHACAGQSVITKIEENKMTAVLEQAHVFVSEDSAKELLNKVFGSSSANVSEVKLGDVIE